MTVQSVTKDDIAGISPKQREAVILMIENWDWSDEAIAAEIGRSRGSISRWKKQPAFQAAYHAELADWEAKVRTRAWANKSRRLGLLIEMLDKQRTHHQSLLELKEARQAAYGDNASNPAIGGNTGNISRVNKPIIGPNGKVHGVHDDEFDKSLSSEIRASSSEIRAIADQIAQELGEKVNKAEVATTVVTRRWIGANPEDV